MKSLDQVIKELPSDLRKEVYDFADYLLTTKVKRKQKKLRMSWAGGLREFRDQYTSLELQKKALEWWGD
ncbi:MAG: DUF2281 domain-containing protein [bacterium]